MGRGRWGRGPGRGGANVRDPGFEALGASLVSAARAMVEDGDDGPFFSQAVPDRLLGHPRLDEALDAFEDDCCAVLGDGRRGEFLSRLCSAASWLEHDDPSSGDGHVMEHQLFAVPMVGTARGVAQVLADVDGMVRAFEGTGFVDGASRLRIPMLLVPVEGLARMGPGATRGVTLSLAGLGDGRDPRVAMEGAMDPEAVAAVAAEEPGRVLAVSLVGLRSLGQRPDHETVDHLSWSGRAMDGDGIPTDEADPEMDARATAWVDAMRALHGTSVEFGVPGRLTDAAVDLASMHVEHVVARHRGLFGVRRGTPVSGTLLWCGPRRSAYAIDHGMGRVVGPVEIPNRVTVYAPDRFVELFGSLLQGVEPALHHDEASFLRAVSGLRAKMPGRHADASRPSPTPPTVTPDADGAGEARPPDNVVPLFGRQV